MRAGNGKSYWSGLNINSNIPTEFQILNNLANEPRVLINHGAEESSMPIAIET